MIFMKPFVSVIIPTLNEEKYIEQTLKSIKNQDYSGKCEVIVVDSKSTDKTVEISKKYADKVVQIKKQGTALGKNIGAKAAKGEILIFLDADTILSKKWIKKAVQYFENPDVGMVTGMIRPREKNWKAMLTMIFWGNILPTITYMLGKGIHIGPSTFAVRKKLFKDLKGFDERKSLGEDCDFAFRVYKNSKVVFEKSLKSYTSMRRFENEGYLKMNFFWMTVGPIIVSMKKNIFKIILLERW